MMQNVINRIRQKLNPFVGGEVTKPTTRGDYELEPMYNSPADGFGRLVKNIPEKNYKELPRFIPISWL